MRHLIIALLSALVITTSPAFAGPGHSHGHAHDPINQEQAAQKAQKRLGQLVARGKIDKSWGGVKADRVEKREYAKGPEWVVIFRNSTIADPAKQTLYMFYKLDGHYLATNYSGK